MPSALYLLALAVFAMGTSEFMLAGLLPAIAADVGVTLGTTGLLTSAFAVGMVVGAPLMAVLARRWPPRPTLVVSLAVFAGCHVAAATTSVFSVLLATRVLSALANAGFLAVALNTATSLVPQERKGRALSILLSGTTIATVAGVPAGALLGTALGWRATFWAIALLCVPAALGITRGLAPGRIPATADPRAVAPVPGLASEFGQLATAPLLVAMGLGALVNAGTFAAFTFLAPVVTGSGLTERWVPISLALFGLGSFAGVTIAGRLSDRWPGRLLAVGTPLLLGVWITVAMVASHRVPLLILIPLTGLLSFGVGSTLITRVLYAGAKAPTMAGAYATAALNVGATLGPALGGVALSTGYLSGYGELAPIWTAASLTAAALLLMWGCRRVLTEQPHRRR